MRPACAAIARLGRAGELPRRIVGADEQHRPGLLAESALDAPDIDGPFRVVLELVRDRRHGVKPGEVIEQRVARPRNEDFIAGAHSSLNSSE